MVSPTSSIIRAATRSVREPLNILTFPTHERYETLLCQTGHNFYSYRAEGIKDWNTNYGEIPDNYVLLDSSLGPQQVPPYVDFDLVLSQNKFGQFQIAEDIAYRLHLPLVSLEHTLPMPQWGGGVLNSMQTMSGDINVFISNYSIGQWGFHPAENTKVITHGVDTELFKPNENIEQENHILSVVNDWINRDWCCGFGIWQNITEGLPHHVVGDTPGLSAPAKDIKDLVFQYQRSRIFLNTSTVSPVPTSLLEAMSCGCAVVTTATCMIPEIVKHGENGFITNDEGEMKQHLVDLLNDEDLAKEMGQAARKTIVDYFTKDQFIQKWDNIFHLAAKSIFRG